MKNSFLVIFFFILSHFCFTIEVESSEPFNFNVTDSKRYYVERLNILGNFQTIEEVIRNKFIVDEGDPFNELLFNKSFDDIRSLGIFRSVKAEVTEGSEESFKIINLNVEEQPTGEIALGAGVGTGGSTIGGGVKDLNDLEISKIQGFDNVVVGKAIYEDKISIESLIQFNAKN